MGDTATGPTGAETSQGRNRSLGHIPERLLTRLWKERSVRQEWFRTSGGRRLRVIYPGRPGCTAGPDFRNALLEVEGLGLVQGDVEIHVRQQDWHSHGHGDDPNYNGVVLHTALVLGQSTADNLQSGHQVPVLSLVPLLDLATQPTAALHAGLWRFLERHGYPTPETVEELQTLLDRAGDSRFLAKSACIQVFLSEQTPEQTLYEGILEALGYRQNQAPFLQLAQRAPYRVLEHAALALLREQRADAIEFWLLRLSGLRQISPTSPSQREPGIISPLSPRGARGDFPLSSGGSASWPRAGFGRPMSGREWHCFRIRPANHPRRRIAGAARLLARFLEPGLVAGLRSIADTGNAKALAATLTVAASPGEGPAYIGAARARDVAVNIVLPLLHALAVAQGAPEGSQRYLELYRGFGRLQDNELTREMAQQLLLPPWRTALNSARRQQGLIHLQHLLAGASQYRFCL